MLLGSGVMRKLKVDLLPERARTWQPRGISALQLAYNYNDGFVPHVPAYLW